MNEMNAHFRASYPAGIASQDQAADAVDAVALGRLMAEIDLAWRGLESLLSAAGAQCQDYPGARRMMLEHADMVRRTARGYRSRLLHELPAGVRHG